jgi:hypothetical protein
MKTDERVNFPPISNKAKGGIARAEKLTPEERSEIARRAAEARWSGALEATHFGSIHIGEVALDAAVLSDGRRVLSQRGVDKALGRKAGGSDWKRLRSSAGNLPVFLAPQNIQPFISTELALPVSTPIVYKVKNLIAYGVEASLLPQICDVWLKARDAGALVPSQMPTAIKADILMRGLAHVGIIALVDEATGYQEVRDRRALEAILDRFLRKELATWAKRFPDEFYQQIFRLKNWQWKGMSVNRPGVVGKYTNDLVYERLAPGILEELQRVNPKNDRGRRKAAHHQWLTEDIGHPALAQHVYALIGFMRASEEWDSFYRMVQRAFPKKNTTLLLPMPDPI